MANHVETYAMMKRLEEGPVSEWVGTACIDLINDRQARLTHDDPALCEFTPRLSALAGRSDRCIQGGDGDRNPQPLRWRVTVLAIILVGLGGIWFAGGAEPVATIAHYWAGG